MLPVRAENALTYTGYQVGGISPFGTRQDMPVYVQASIFDLETIYINGGKRGFLVEIAVADFRYFARFLMHTYKNVIEFGKLAGVEYVNAAKEAQA